MTGRISLSTKIDDDLLAMQKTKSRPKVIVEEYLNEDSFASDDSLKGEDQTKMTT